MKKILLILFLVSGVLFGQTTWTKYDKIEGRNSKHVKGDSSAINVYILNADDDTLGVISILLTQAQIDSLQKSIQEGTWDINDISGTISLPTGASTSALQDTIISRFNTLNAKDFATQTTLALVPPLLDSLEVDIESVETAADAIRVATELIDNAISGSEMQVDIVAELPAGTNNIGNVGLTDGSESMMIDNGATYDGIFVRLTDGTNVSSLSGTGDLEVSGDGGVALATSANQSTLITRADTSNARIQEIKLDIENLKIYNAPATKYVGLTDTVTTRTDTTTVTGTWVEGEIKADDSCEVAIDGSFPSGQTFIITETTAVKLPKWAVATSNKLFVRRYGVGTVRFYLRLNSY